MICLLCMTRVCFAEQVAGASLILLVPTSREKLGKVINLQLDETQPDDWSFQRKCLLDNEICKSSKSQEQMEPQTPTSTQSMKINRMSSALAGARIDLVSFVGLILFTYSSSL